MTASKIRRGSHSGWGCTQRGQTRQYGIERGGGSICYLGPFGTHLNPVQPGWNSRSRGNELDDWLLFIMGFWCSRYWTSLYCAVSSDVGPRGVSRSIPGKEASRWSLEQIFKLYLVGILSWKPRFISVQKQTGRKIRTCKEIQYLAQLMVCFLTAKGKSYISALWEVFFFSLFLWSCPSKTMLSCCFVCVFLVASWIGRSVFLLHRILDLQDDQVQPSTVCVLNSLSSWLVGILTIERWLENKCGLSTCRKVQTWR